jgi:hypothetical protein
MKAAIAAAPVAEIDLGFIAPTLRWCRTPLPGGLVAGFFCATAFPIGQDTKVLHCRRVVTMANRSLTVLKRPGHCCAKQRERENAASNGHGVPYRPHVAQPVGLARNRG